LPFPDCRALRVSIQVAAGNTARRDAFWIDQQATLKRRNAKIVATFEPENSDNASANTVP
jgi:hypothetical protein